MEKNLREDTGFSRMLDSLPSSYRDHLKAVLTDESFLANAVNLLPSSQRDHVTSLFTSIFTAHQEALRLYKQCRFFEARTGLQETIDLYSQAPRTGLDGLDRLVGFSNKRVQALCYDLLADVEGSLGNTALAGKLHHQALQLAEEIEDIDTMVKALQGLGAYHWELGEFGQGLACCKQALERSATGSDRWRTRISILTTLSVLYEEIGQFDTALDHAFQAVNLCTESETTERLPLCLNNLACLFLDQDDFDSAFAALEEGLAVLRVKPNPQCEALLLSNLAMCHRRPRYRRGLGLAEPGAKHQ